LQRGQVRIEITHAKCGGSRFISLGTVEGANFWLRL
jgi:hypothetical protein